MNIKTKNVISFMLFVILVLHPFSALAQSFRRDDNKAKFGFSTVAYSNPTETTRLINEEIAFAQGQDRTAEILATPDGQVVANIPGATVDLAKENPYTAGAVIVVGGVAVCYLACPVGFVASVVTSVGLGVTWASTKIADILTKFQGSPMVQTWKFSQDTINKAVDYVTKVDPNKLIHIFEKTEHGLTPLVEKLGTKENVVRAVVNSLNGVLPKASTSFRDVVVNVGSYSINVSGEIIDGVIRIGTMFVVKN